jgi:hypothetical protein
MLGRYDAVIRSGRVRDPHASRADLVGPSVDPAVSLTLVARMWAVGLSTSRVQPTTSAGRRRRLGRRRAADGRHGGRCRCTPRSLRPDLATAGSTPASRNGRVGRWRSGPCRQWSRRRPSPRCHRPLVRVHADDKPLCSVRCVPPMLNPLLVREPGGQRYFELSKPLLSLSLLTCCGARTAQAR